MELASPWPYYQISSFLFGAGMPYRSSWRLRLTPPAIYKHLFFEYPLSNIERRNHTFAYKIPATNQCDCLPSCSRATRQPLLLGYAACNVVLLRRLVLKCPYLPACTLAELADNPCAEGLLGLSVRGVTRYGFLVDRGKQ
jgi:hypothetical protein